jgi:hypothetical protein
VKHTLVLDGYHPTPLNRLIGCHWGTVARLKKVDRQRIAIEALAQRVPQATGKRKVGLHLVLGPRQRACDTDAYWKSTLDALVSAGLLVDDSDRWCSLSPLTFERGSDRRTIIALEDLPYS